jgi:erythronate-4-phosphate dehydrogenase
LETVLAESDIITLHVPLTREGADRTVHMADRRFFARATRARVFVNAARGPVVDSDALLAALAPPLPRPAQQGEGRGEGAFRRVVLDTWEGEPAYRTDLMRAVDLATPHIAGHSFEGKVMGTLMVYREACRFLGVAPEWTPEGRLPPPPVPRLEARAAGRPDEDVLWEIVQAVYDIREDDRRFRETAVPDAARRAREFDRLRREYPERREFPFTEVTLRGASPRLAEKVRGLGFRVKAV